MEIKVEWTSSNWARIILPLGNDLIVVRDGKDWLFVQGRETIARRKIIKMWADLGVASGDLRAFGPRGP